MASASTWRVMVQFTANNLTGSGFASLISSINQAHTGTKNLHAALAALQVAGGSALIGFGKTALNVFDSMIQKAGDYQMKMVMIQQSMGDPAKIGYDKFNLGLQALARQRMDLMIGSNPTMFGLDQLADIQRQLLASGFTPGQITRTGARGGSLGQIVAYEAEKEQLRGLSTDPTSTVRNLGQFLKAYGLSGDAARDAINTFAKAQSVTSHFSSQDLRYSEQYFGSLARTINMKPEDMIILSGFMSRMGATSTSGATALNNLFLQSLDPTKGASNFESSRRFQAAMGLGILGHVNPAEARAEIMRNQAQMRALGLPADLSHMTAAQREKLARSALVETIPNKMMQLYRERGLQGMSDFFDQSRGRLEKEYGKQAGDDKMAVYLAQLLNLRGARGGFIVSATDRGDGQDYLTGDQRKGLGGRSALMNYAKQVTGQQDIDVLIAQARNTLHGQEATASNRFNAILLSLAGVNLATGKPIDGGPMATVLKLLQYLNQIMAEVLKFTTSHPQAASQMGMVIGGVGVIATIIGTILTGLGALGLVRAGLGPGGGALLKALPGAVGSRLGAFGPGAALDSMGYLFNHAVANTQDWWHWGKTGEQFMGPRMPATTGIARGIGGAFGRIPGMGALGGIFDALASHMGVLFTVLKIGIPRLLGWVGWITLAIDALDFFSKHPKDIGTWVGEILKLFRDTLIPGTIKLIGMFVNYIFDELKKLAQFAQFWSNPLEVGKFGQSFMNSVMKVLNDDGKTKSNTTKQGPHGHPTQQGGHSGGGHVRISYNLNFGPGTNPSDARKHADLIVKHTTAMLKDSLYSTVGGMGVPGRPAARVGA